MDLLPTKLIVFRYFGMPISGSDRARDTQGLFYVRCHFLHFAYRKNNTSKWKHEIWLSICLTDVHKWPTIGLYIHAQIHSYSSFMPYPREAFAHGLLDNALLNNGLGDTHT